MIRRPVLTGCAIAIAILLLVTAINGTAHAVTYCAGYENENDLTNRGQISAGSRGIRSTIYTPSAYTLGHEGTIKAVVEAYFPSVGGAWYARTGWKVNIGYRTPEAYWEGFDRYHNYIWQGYGALTMGSGQEYKIYPLNISGDYRVSINGSYRTTLYMGTSSALPMFGIIRASGDYNDVRAKFMNTQLLWLYNPDSWVPMGYFPNDRAVSPQQGGLYYKEALLPGANGKDDYTAWNSLYGQYY
jgi:hypothetical protein